MRLCRPRTVRGVRGAGLGALLAVAVAGGGLPGGAAAWGEEGFAPIWRKAMGGAIIAPPSAQGGSAAVVNDAGQLVTFGEDGQVLWKFAPGNLLPYLTRSPEGTAYVGRVPLTAGGAGELIAVNRVGRELWRVSLPEPLAAPVILGWDGRIFVFTLTTLGCYTASGSALWTRALQQPLSSLALRPGADGRGGFFLAFQDGELYLVDPFGQAISYTLGAPPALVVPLALPLPEDAAGAGAQAALLLGYAAGELELFWPGEAGETAAREPLPALALPGAPVAAAAGTTDGEVSAAVLLATGQVTLLSLSSRETRWIAASGFSGFIIEETRAGAAPGAPGGNVLWDDGRVYVLSLDGAAGFSAAGEPLWTLRVTAAATLPAFSPGGVLYSGGGDWILYAYRLEDRPAAALVPGGPEGSYGLGKETAPAGQTWSGDFLDQEFTRIRRDLDAGTVGDREPDYAAWLMAVAGSSRDLAPRTAPRVFITHRVTALDLLGRLGSRETVPFLVSVFLRDQDSAAKAAAAAAVGRIGTDGGGALAAFSSVILTADAQTLTAVAAAVGALCRVSGPPLGQVGIPLLVDLADPRQPPAVRRQAEKELLSLSQGGGD